jgi:hypothetical protein
LSGSCAGYGSKRGKIRSDIQVIVKSAARVAAASSNACPIGDGSQPLLAGAPLRLRRVVFAGPLRALLAMLVRFRG